MTLQEMWLIFKRYIALVLIVCLLGVGAAVGYYKASGKGEGYEAAAYIAVNSNLNSALGLTNNTIRNRDAYKDVALSADAHVASNTITVKAKGSNPEELIAAANAVAEDVKEESQKMFVDFKDPFDCSVSLAQLATSSDGSIVKYAGIGAAAGFFVALCLLVLIDMRQKKIKTAEGAATETELPVLVCLPKDSGEKLLANVRFAAERAGISKEALSVLIVPCGQTNSAEMTADILSSAAKDQDTTVEVTVAEPLSTSMKGAYAAQKADLVLVSVQQWKDNLPSLLSSVDELRFAEAQLGGIVFCTGKLESLNWPTVRHLV